MTTNIFLSFDDGAFPVVGNSADPDHKGSFDVAAVDFALFNAFLDDNSSRTTVQPLLIEIAGMSPGGISLQEALLTETSFQQATLTIATDTASSASDTRVLQNYTLTGAQVQAMGLSQTGNTTLAVAFDALTIETIGYNSLGQVDDKLTREVEFVVDTTSIALDGVGGAQRGGDDPSGAIFDGFLKIDGVSGGSRNEVHKGEFELLDMQFGLARPDGGTSPIEPVFVDMDPNDTGLVSLLGRVLTGDSGAAVFSQVQSGLGDGSEQVVQTISPGRVISSSFIRDDDHATRIGFTFLDDLTAKLAVDLPNLETTAEYSFDAKAPALDGDPQFSGFGGLGQAIQSEDRYFLEIDGIANPDGGLVSNLSTAFELSGFGFGVETTAFVDRLGEVSVETPLFTTLTADFLGTEIEFSQVLEALSKDSEFDTVKITRSTSDQVTLETVELAGAAIEGLFLKNDLAPRVTFDFEAIQYKGFEVSDDGAKSTPDTVVPWSVNKGSLEFVAADDRTGFSGGLMPSDGVIPREARDDGSFDYFLKLEGIEGESVAESFENAFDVFGYEFDVSRALGFGDTPGRLIAPFSVDLDPRDPGIVNLMASALGGKMPGSLDFTATRGASQSGDFDLRVSLDDPFILGLDTGSSSATRVNFGYSGGSVEFGGFDSKGVFSSEVVSLGTFVSEFSKDSVVFSPGVVTEFDRPDQSSVVRDPGQIFMEVTDAKLGPFDGAATTKEHLDDFIVGNVDFDLARPLLLTQSDTDRNGLPDTTTLGFQSALDRTISVDLRPGQVGNLGLMNAMVSGEVLDDVKITQYFDALPGTVSPNFQTIDMSEVSVIDISMTSDTYTRVVLAFQDATIEHERTDESGQSERSEIASIDANILGQQDPGLAGSPSTTSRIAFDTSLRSFLSFDHESITGTSVDAEHEDQFELFDWSLDLDALYSFEQGRQTGVDLAPLTVRLPAFNPGLVELMEVTQGGGRHPRHDPVCRNECRLGRVPGFRRLRVQQRHPGRA